MISVIVPVLNEAVGLQSFLKHTLSLEGDYEVIVVDGGSEDGTLEILGSSEKVVLVKSDRGRALQMNKGACQAKGEYLLFLHADTFLPPQAFFQIEEALEALDCVGGNFRITFDNPNVFLKMYAWFSQFNHSFFTYGDQAIFIRQSTFSDLGGFKQIPLMEDVEIQWRLRSKGRMAQLRSEVITSARRFEENGFIWQFLVDMLLVMAYRIGISPYRLKRFYPDT